MGSTFRRLSVGAGAAAVLGLGCILQAASPESSSAGARWWAHVRYLADDKLEGRLTGSEGYLKAAEYVEQRFKDYGLKPAGSDGYRQEVRFVVQRVAAADSSLHLVRDGAEERLSIGEDALLSSRLPQPQAVDAPLAFVGYALHLPDEGYDDFAGQDLKGKILVYINGGPASLSGPLKSHARAGQEFARAVERTGAIGAISIPNPKSMDIPWRRMSLAASQPGMWLADAGLQDSRGPMFSAIFNPDHAGKLFVGSGHSFTELLALADASKPMPRFPLAASLRAHVETRSETVASPNLAGVVPGSDAGLKDEVVVLSAHLDHLGVGEPINGDKIYNGAMDNASGVATLLETARAINEGTWRPRRSVLFLVVCGEEKGLLGSRYFAGHPTVPPSALAANLNVDMFLPIYSFRYLTVQGLNESSLGLDVRAVGAGMGVEILADRHPDRNLFIRSDQYNFIRKGVPALAFSFGNAPGSPEEKLQKDWLTNRYHAPSDDGNQPVDLAAAAKFNLLLLKLTQRVADEDRKPTWNQDSFFRRFASK